MVDFSGRGAFPPAKVGRLRGFPGLGGELRKPDGTSIIRLLLVEDHAPTRMLMSRLIRETGTLVVTARDGREALSYLLHERFDVLLTDLRMPIMDGFDLIAEVSELPPSHKPRRIIAISGVYEPGALRGLPINVNFLPKPFNLETLLEMLTGKLN
ncbi:MAG: response regulator [Phycisphaerae bacterium]|nr:response regulator [Phycisphaerae bacterium]